MLDALHKARRPTLSAAFVVCLLGSSSGQAEPPQLKISATYPQEPTGTMHYAERVEISLGTLEPLVLSGEEDFGVAIPGPQYRLDDTHFLLLGWSSGGSGMQTLHAMLIEIQGKALALAKDLLLLTDRPSAGVIVRPEVPGRVRLGVVEPGEFVHDGEIWTYGAEPDVLDLEGIRKLPYEDYAAAEGDSIYAPPFGKLPKGRVAWITVTAGGFVFPPPAPPTPANPAAPPR